MCPRPCVSQETSTLASESSGLSRKEKRYCLIITILIQCLLCASSCLKASIHVIFEQPPSMLVIQIGGKSPKFTAAHSR